MIYEKAELIKKTKLKENVFSIILNCKEIEKKATPGQFANILIEGFTLRRPFSICEIEKDQINIVFNVKGKGTKKMASWQEGKSVNIIAPLGKGFAPLKKEEKILLVGGGIGLAPLLCLCKKEHNITTLAGFNSREDIILKEEFKKFGDFLICTKDGSLGEKGFVTDYVKKYVKKYGITRIASCGPNQMLEKVLKIAKEGKIFCEISLEERMACGIGACLCCQHILNENSNKKIVHVCKDGPVFKFSP